MKNVSKKIKILLIITAFISTEIKSQIIQESFDTVANLWTRGWVQINHSTWTTNCNSCTWVQGYVGPLQSGALGNNPLSMISANYGATGNNCCKINLWLLTPRRTFNNGDLIQFLTFSGDSTLGSNYPDRLQVRLSMNDTSSNVGVSDTAVGDFTTLLLDINPTYSPAPYPMGYPGSWRMFTINISGLSVPVSGRLAFRYFIMDHTTQSTAIGIDGFVYTPYGEVSTLEIKNKNEIRLVQQAERGKFIIESGEKIISIQCFDENGKIIYETNHPEIDFSEQRTGIYFYRVITEKGSYTGKLFVE